ncbi:hypothetical protein HKX48_009072 [Thoreauomyces humboldtii]|nr:hypothetical protein HKX48_009072 [Thoreauomyces humboldtii]
MVAETSEEFKRLEHETDIRRDFTEQVFDALQIYLKSMGKRKESATDKVKKMPLEIMAESMIHFGTMLHEESLYGKALVKFGESHEKIACYQVEYISGVRESYVNNLERIVTDMKDYAGHKAKLERRRLDFDAKLNKVHKSRKEKPELEEETRVAQAKYEESLTDTTTKMIELNSNEDEQLEDLLRFMDAEAEYHRKSYETISALQKALAEYEILLLQMHTTDSLNLPRGSMPGMDRKLSYASSAGSMVYPMVGQNGGTVPAPAPHRQHSGSTMLQAPTPGPNIKQVTVIFDFDAEGPEELTLRKGDLVNIICEIDEGWWEGEIVGSGEIGMFPSNYVAAVTAEIPPPTPFRLDPILPHPTELVHEPDGAHYPNDQSSDVESDHMDHHVPARPDSEINFSPTAMSQQRPQDRPYSHISRLSFVPTNAPIPLSQQVGGDTSSAPSSRRPSGAMPPPPASPASRASQSNIHNARPPPHQQQQAKPVASVGRSHGGVGGGGGGGGGGDPPATATGPCATCGCEEFAPNAFRRETCSNCFHKHGM